MTDAAKRPATDPIARAWWGRSWNYRDAWECVIQFLPMRSLMTRRSDEGRMVLTALEVTFGFRRSLQRYVNDGGGFWRPFIWVRSDVDEITNRRAGLA